MMKINLETLGLERFVAAQDRGYDAVLDELALGKKTTHWMWFIFPQLKALGRSPVAKHFGIESLHEAVSYWQHPILRARLLECTQLLLQQANDDVFEIFGSPDHLKFRSCMTLFGQTAPQEPVFQQALERFYDGKSDEATLQLLPVRNVDNASSIRPSGSFLPSKR